MTRAESDALKQERNRQDYLSRRDRKRAVQRAFYQRHREDILKKQFERRNRGREHTDPPYRTPSTDACESELPYGLRKDKAALRAEYRKIPITERPPYDYFLRCKTVEYIRNYARREQQDTTARSDGHATTET